MIRNGLSVIYHHRTQATDAQGIHIREISQAFERLGYTVVKVALVGDEAIGKESREGLIYKVLQKTPGWLYEILELGYNFFGVLRLLKVTRKTRPRFIYERYSAFNISGLLVAWITGVPLILEVNAPLAKEKEEFSTIYFFRLAQFIETLLINRSFMTIAVTEVLKNMLIREGAHPDKITVMWNGVNIEEYANFNTSNRTATYPLTAGFVGWFRDWHGLKELILSLKEDLHEGSIRLLLVGDGPIRKGIEDIINQLRLQGKVVITGALNRADVLDTLKKIDIALQPAATIYSSPMKILEYMAAGKAIVAVDQENIREVLHDGINALLFPPGDWSQMADKVRMLCNDPVLVERLGIAAKVTVVREQLMWENNARRISDLFIKNLVLPD